MLTTREIEVLEHLSEGKSNRKIALDMYISEYTLKSHIRNIYGKIDIPSWAHPRAWLAIHAAEVIENN